MSLAYDFVVAAVIAVIAFVVQIMAIELFAPGTGLHTVASQATNLDGASRADLWYRIFALWIPLGGYVTALAWPLIRAYRRQAATAITRAP